MKWSEFAQKPIFNLIKLLLVFVITAIVCYIAVKAAALLAPFLLALICAMIMEPIVRRLCKLHINGHYLPRSIASISTMLVVGTVVVILLTWLVNSVLTQVYSIVQAVPAWVNDISIQLKHFAVWVEERVGILPDDVAAGLTSQVSSLLSTLVSRLSGMVNPLALGVWTTAQRIPIIILSVIMYIVGTFYMSAWRPRMTKYMRENLPSAWMERIVSVKNRLFSTMFAYIRAQLLILLAVFIIIFVGLNILSVDYALVIALLIALLDALPVLGSGLFLNTWAVYCIATGNWGMALGLFLTYIVVIAGRNLLEPRLISVQIGLPPLLTMAAMYGGFRLFGIWGLIGGPILMVILRIVFEFYANGRTLKQILNGTPPPAHEDAPHREVSKQE